MKIKNRKEKKKKPGVSVDRVFKKSLFLTHY